jgi:uncharacterized LabA/DUF88 family protein
MSTNSESVVEATVATKKDRCVVYIDGFNWYYGIFKHLPQFKWLNIQTFFEALRPDEEIVSVKFFSALVEPEKAVSLARNRQTEYIRALRTLKKVKVVLGKYQMRSVRCGATCGEEYKAPEEKKTDVNIAVNLLSDSVKERAESLVIVSGDSDLEPAARWIRVNYPKMKMAVYIPNYLGSGEVRRADFYENLNVTCRHLPIDNLAAHQLPGEIQLANGDVLKRPDSWVPWKYPQI